MNRGAVAAAAVLLAAGCGSSAPVADSRGSVVGRVLSAPSCPVEHAGVPCPPRPVADASVVALRAGRVLATTRTDAHGRFQLTVPAGRCTLRATNPGPLATTTARVVGVTDGRTVHVRLVVDSGIR